MSTRTSYLAADNPVDDLVIAETEAAELEGFLDRVVVAHREPVQGARHGATVPGRNLWHSGVVSARRLALSGLEC